MINPGSTRNRIFWSLPFAVIGFSILITSCSNFLSDPRIDPSREPIGSSEATLVPTISGDVAQDGVTALSSVTLSVAWPEVVTGFEESDLILENATVDSFAGSDDSYTVTLLPTSDGQVGFTIPESSVTGISEDTNLEAIFTFTRNSAALTLSVSSTAPALTNQSSIPLQFLFSEDVTGFDIGDISASNGILSSFAGSGSLYTASLSFSADGLATVSVADEAALDAASGERMTPPAALGVTYDGTVPTVVLSSPITNGATAGYSTVDFTVTFSEEVSGFDMSDLDVSNATLSGFSGSGDTYSVTLTPVTDGSVTLNIPVDSAVDSASNGNEAATTFSYDYDSSAVAVNFTSSESDPTNAGTVTVDIDFDLPMDGFDPVSESGDFVLTGATWSNFSGSGANYHVDVSPTGEGTVTLTVPSGVADSETTVFPNVESSFSFYYDPVPPTAPVFNVRGLTTDTVASASSAINELAKIELTTDYSGDTGSSLTFEYTSDAGSSWSAFVNNYPLTAEGLYAGINIRVSDEAGNSVIGTQLSNLTIDTVDPNSPIVNIDTDPVKSANESSFGFSITAGEAGADYNYEILSDAGTPGVTADDPTPITGTGTLDGSGEAIVTGLDSGSLDDGTVTIRVRQADTAGNQSGWAQDAAAKDTVIPATPTVVILNSDPVNSLSNASFSFDISGGEAGLEYSYTVSSTGAGAIISSSAIFGGTGTASIGPMDISAIKDGTLTVSVVQADAVANISPAGTDTVLLDAVAVNEIDLPDLVDNANKGSVPVILTGEAGSSYDYVITSSNGGSAVDASGSGSYDGSGLASLSLNLTDLNDGWLVMIVTVDDTAGNTSTEFGIVEKESVGPPLTGIADFSGEPGDVSFDMSYHGYQTLPSDTVVRYDTVEVIGSDFNDTIKFSALEDGESFTVTGGTGSNTIDLSRYFGSDITIQSGDIDDGTKANTGSITVDLGGAQSATIENTDIIRFVFNSNVFDGTPHGLEFEATDHEWSYNSKTVTSQTRITSRKPLLVDFKGSLSTNFVLDMTVAMFDDGPWQNGGIVFDYVSDSDFKGVEAGGGADNWRLVDSGSEIGAFSEVLEANLAADFPAVTYEYPVQLRVTGVDGKTAELWSGGVKKTEATFSEVLNDGRIGVVTVAAKSIMTLNMGPSDWAPYARDYDSYFSHSGTPDITLDLLGDAADAEGQLMSLVSVSPTNSRLTDNGNGTVTYDPPGTFYGEDLYTYVITDGINQTTGTIRFDVTP